MSTVKQLMADGAAALAESDSARLDAEVLLGCVLKKNRAWLYTWPEYIPSLPEQHLYLEMIRQRQEGKPVGYLTGRKEFWNLELKVNDSVLIPRPETETLVETALEKLAAAGEGTRIADLGTGSGAIALALASERPGWQVTATDIAGRAIALARENAARLGITNVDFTEGDWLAPLEGQAFDAIVSNPPYIDADDPHLQEGDVRFEPSHTLVSAENGLADIRCIADQAASHLEPGGWLLLEHAYNQGLAVREILVAAGYEDIETIKDLSGNDRVTAGQVQGTGYKVQEG